MRSLGRLGLALSAATIATAVLAATDSRAATSTSTTTTSTSADVPLDMPVEPVGRATPPIRGGWARDGWSDSAAPAEPPPRPPEGTRADVPRPDAGRSAGPRPAGPRPVDWRADGPNGDGGVRAGDWRRQTWDGGLGRDYRYRRGDRLPAVFTAPRYDVRDWGGYGLRRPAPGHRWVRYYDDAVLLDPRGYVVDAVPAIGWDDDRWDDPRLAYDQDGYGPGRRWRDDGVMWRDDDRHHPPYMHRMPGGGVTTVTVRSPSTVTTTTTTVEESYVTTSPARTWRRVARAPASKLLKRSR